MDDGGTVVESLSSDYDDNSPTGGPLAAILPSQASRPGSALTNPVVIV